MLAKGKEKRKHTRLPIDLEYVLIVEQYKYTGHISNIGLSGACLASISAFDAKLEPGKKGVLEINTEQGWQKLACEIVYVGSNDEFFPDGVGVFFSERDFETSSTIWNLAIQYLIQDDALFVVMDG